MLVENPNYISLFMTLAVELSQLRGKNCIRTIQLRIEINANRRYKVLEEWELTDVLLTRDGWPKLEDVAIGVPVDQDAYEHRPGWGERIDYFTALEDISSTHFTRLDVLSLKWSDLQFLESRYEDNVRAEECVAFHIEAFV
ncbi:hypothetical protein BXZ70DRAFT_907762 [Cristinia sonorae]|uniref:Uncharacterized protein n=1 Tax=Cristinia sonorae TaxID=1940300 RepID=A0A8K0UMN5_9AGAR|nr:hypothetical protein BXZ70DRAFT_907762 [Cristinia sonorae]